MSRNLFAYTALGSSFPEYISVNVEGDGVKVDVRQSPRNAEQAANGSAPLASIVLSREQVHELGRQLLEF